jgi:hypothetical protein
MTNGIINHHPVKMSSSSGNEPFKSLEKDQKTRLLEMIELDSVNNPWKNEAVRYRNRLIIYISSYIWDDEKESCCH